MKFFWAYVAEIPQLVKRAATYVVNHPVQTATAMAAAMFVPGVEEAALAADAAELFSAGVEGEAADMAASASVAAADEALPTFAVDATRMPNIARNVQQALDEGHPGLLNRTTDPLRIRANRQAAWGFCGPGSPDEYPFASSLQGGAGSRVQGVPLAEQRIQGGMLARFYAQHALDEGDPFRVIVTGLSP